MYKGKYALLQEHITGTSYPKDSFIFISFSSLMNDWHAIVHGYGLENARHETTLTSSWIASHIMDIVIHYKQFFEKYRTCSRVFVFIYRGEKEYYNPIVSLTPEIDEAFSMLTTICRYIPNIYCVYLHHLVSALFPYDILRRTILGHITDNRTVPTESLIVSAHFVDYGVIALGSIQNKRNIWVFRRKYPTLFTQNTILTDLIYKDSNANLILKDFTVIYPLTLIAYAKRYNLSHLIPCEVSNYVRSILRHARLKKTMLTADILLENPIDAYREYVDMHYAETLHFKELQTHQSVWKIDQIDYTIEKLNETFFRDRPINFHALL
jgi:hypothetical protein